MEHFSNNEISNLISCVCHELCDERIAEKDLKRQIAEGETCLAPVLKLVHTRVCYLEHLRDKLGSIYKP